MRRIRLNSLQLNVVTINSAGERWRGSHAGAPPVVPDVPDIPDIPEEPDVPSNPEVDENGYLRFADPVVAEICATNWGDGTGITPEQAAAVTSIGTVFRANTEITSFEELPKFEKAQAIPDCAFDGCNALRKIDLSQVTSLGASALYNCTSLEIDDLNLPNLETLGLNAFYGVKIKKISNLGKITALPTTYPSPQNFGNKSVLEEVVLPDSITNLPEFIFSDYKLLKSINLHRISTFGRSAFSGCSSLSGVLDLSNTVIFDGWCFSDCTNLEDIYIGEKVESLNIIYRYKKFKYSPDGVLRFPKLKKLIGPIFQDALIKRVESLGEVTDIGAYDSCYTFWGSTIEYCDIPATCTTIRSSAFYSAKSLSVVVCHAVEPPTITGFTFGDNASNFTIYVPDASVEAYKTATNWNTYADRILPLSEYVEQ